MKYFDEQLLDNLSTEAICKQLDAYQEIENNIAILEKHRAFHSKVMEELLKYFLGRLAQELREEFGDKIKVVAQEEDVINLPS